MDHAENSGETTRRKNSDDPLQQNRVPAACYPASHASRTAQAASSMRQRSASGPPVAPKTTEQSMRLMFCLGAPNLQAGLPLCSSHYNRRISVSSSFVTVS